MNLVETLTYVVIAVSIDSLAYGSYTDVRKRTVKALLFTPLVLLAAVQAYFFIVPMIYLVLGILIFFFTFLAPDTYAYELIGAIFLVVSVVALFLSGFYWGFQLIVMSMVFLLGFRERMFGIGDIKAIIALMFASPFYSPIVATVYQGSRDYTILPTSLALLTDVSIFAVVFVAYAIIKVYRHGTANIPGQPLAMKYSEKMVARNPAAYRKLEKDGTHYMLYRIPFIVPIALGYLLFITVGFFPYLL